MFETRMSCIDTKTNLSFAEYVDDRGDIREIFTLMIVEYFLEVGKLYLENSMEIKRSIFSVGFNNHFNKYEIKTRIDIAMHYIVSGSI